MKRNAGIDLLRILSMYMICMLHTLGRAGGLSAAKVAGGRYYKVAWLIETSCYCAVDCYGLVSGYVHVNNPPHLSQILYLYLQVVFLSVLITITTQLLSSTAFCSFIHVSRQDWLLALAPITHNSLWYFTAYFAVYAVVLVLGDTPTSNNSAMAIVVITLVFQLLPNLVGRDIFLTANGYSALWLFTLYLLGRSARMIIETKGIKPIYLLLGYCICIIVAWADFMKLIPEFGFTRLDYTSPTIVLAALFLLGLFANLSLATRVERLVISFAQFTFGVYVIHTNPIIWRYLDNALGFISSYPLSVYLVVIHLAAVLMYICCTAVDGLRLGLFKLLRVKEVVKRVDQLVVRLHLTSQQNSLS